MKIQLVDSVENFECEEWRPITGFPDYEVSSLGRIKRIKDSKNNRKAGFILKPHTDADYSRVYLFGPKGKKRLSIHLIVLNTFLGPSPPGYEANHKDGKKRNNLLNNLEWVTHPENINHSYALGLNVGKKGETNSQAKLTEDEVGLIRKLVSEGKLFQKDIGTMFDITQSNVSCIKLGKSWGHIPGPTNNPVSRFLGEI